MRLGLAIGCLFLCGCAYTPEFTMIAGPKRIEDDREFGVTMMLLQKFGERGHGVCGLGHASDPQHGAPFNDDEEVTMDSGGCGFRVGGGKR